MFSQVEDIIEISTAKLEGFDPFSATRRLKRRQNKVRVEGFLSKYLISSLVFFFFHGSMKKVQPV